MFNLLPTELVVKIVQQAAWKFVADDRSTVIHLAQTSKMVYQLVAPVLYHTAVITSRNIVTLYELITSPETAHLAERVGPLVSVLVFMFAEQEDEANRHDVVLGCFTNVTSFDGAPYFLDYLIYAGNSSISKLSIYYCHSFAGGISDIPEVIQRNLTRLVGIISRAEDCVDIPHMLHMLPALSHIGFDLLEVDEDGGMAVVQSFNTSAFEQILVALHEFKQLRCITIRVAGSFCHRWAEMQQVVHRLKDSRVQMQQDSRERLTWEEENQISISDALHGRTMWTEAVALQF
ncbi:hypothetical protein BKA62DRAFT_826428 [Auriculariales sp. MPI-PUGE-AT-0066]|nr:hypothetical protein BKA62DRAFT_826428 [Auriculariales sp. MPI-PUGE-AT-0066]